MHETGSPFFVEVSCARKGLTLTITLTLETEIEVSEDFFGVKDLTGFGVAAMRQKKVQNLMEN